VAEICLQAVLEALALDIQALECSNISVLRLYGVSLSPRAKTCSEAEDCSVLMGVHLTVLANVLLGLKHSLKTLDLRGLKLVQRDEVDDHWMAGQLWAICRVVSKLQHLKQLVLDELFTEGYIPDGLDILGPLNALDGLQVCCGFAMDLDSWNESMPRVCSDCVCRCRFWS
jgi:hypothetical protein